jgi:hypothetical protein
VATRSKQLPGPSVVATIAMVIVATTTTVDQTLGARVALIDGDRGTATADHRDDRRGEPWSDDDRVGRQWGWQRLLTADEA